MENSDSGSKLNRRRALQMLGVGVAVGGLFALEACKGGGSESTGSSGSGASTDDCSKDIDDNSENLRRTLQYKAKAVDPAKHCSACAQFIEGKYGACGGGCKVIPGAVNPIGGCLSFAPKAAGAAPSSSG
jgi:hypothetical protein